MTPTQQDTRLVDEQEAKAELVDIDNLPAIADSAAPVALRSSESLVQDDEWSGVDDGDLSPSDAFFIPLYQLNRKAGGGFLNEDTGETVDEIRAVLMAKVNTRAWWPQQFGKGDQAPSCRSANGVEADPARSPALAEDWTMPARDLRGNPSKPTGVCAECPNSQWDGDEPPPCGEAIEFLAFVPTDHGAGRIARLRFSGMAFAPARAYWQSFKTRMPRRPPIAFITRITLEERETANGTFLIPKFQREAELTVPDARPVIDVRDRSIGEWTTQVAEDPRPTDVHDDAGPPSYPPEDEEPF